MGWVSYLFGFKGRLGPGGFWLYVAITLPCLVALYVAFYIYAMSFPNAYENGGPTPLPSDPFGVAGAIVWALALGLLIVAGMAMAVRRLHDRNKSWWWLLVFAVLPNSLYGLAQYLLQTNSELADRLAIPLLSFSLVLFAWGFVEIGLLPGTQGANRFGPAPSSSNT